MRRNGGNALNVVIIVVSLLLAVVFLATGLSKAAGGNVANKQATRLGIPMNAYRGIGFAEIAAAVGLVLGLWWRPVGIVAAAVLVAITVGATVVHRRIGDPPKASIPVLILGVLALLDFILLVS